MTRTPAFSARLLKARPRRSARLAALDETVRGVVERVMRQLSVPLDAVPGLSEPAVLRRPDGDSVYTVHGSASFTSTAILDAESRLPEAVERADGHVAPRFSSISPSAGPSRRECPGRGPGRAATAPVAGRRRDQHGKTRSRTVAGAGIPAGGMRRG